MSSVGQHKTICKYFLWDSLEALVAVCYTPHTSQSVGRHRELYRSSQQAPDLITSFALDEVGDEEEGD